jgi:hypothetical protein
MRMSDTTHHTYTGPNTESQLVTEWAGYPFLEPFSIYKDFGNYTELYELLDSDSKGSSKLWKNCQHYKSAKLTTPTMTDVPVHVYKDAVLSGRAVFKSVYAFASSQFGDLGRLNYGLPDLVNESGGSWSIPEPPGLEALVQRGLNSTLPYIKAELSIVNSLIELKDFKSLPESALRVIRLLEQKIFSLGGVVNTGYYVARTLRDFIYSAVQTGSDAYLQAQFNIIPLLSDIRGIRTALSRLEKRINDLIAQQGRPQRKHFSFTFWEFRDMPDFTAPTSLDTFPFPFVEGQVVMDRYTTTSPTTFHFEIEYNYNFTQYQEEHALLLGLLDSLGVNLNPQIIWNAIPWSFVVDWVAKVGNYLNQFQVRNMEPVINIRRCLWSVTRERRIVVSKKVSSLDAPTDPAFSSYTQLPVIRETSYRRDVFLPGSSSIELSGLSSKEFSLGAALVIAQKRHHYRR